MNRMRVAITALTAVALLGFGCGSESSREGRSGGGASPGPPATPSGASSPEECGEQIGGEDPDDTASYIPCPGDGDGSAGGKAQRTEPQPGQADVRPVRWERAAAKNGRVRVFYWSGVEPCHVLDHVEVEESERKITVTLFEGRAETDEDVACIEVAVLKYTDVRLDSPAAGRKIIDGARGG